MVALVSLFGNYVHELDENDEFHVLHVSRRMERWKHWCEGRGRHKSENGCKF